MKKQLCAWLLILATLLSMVEFSTTPVSAAEPLTPDIIYANDTMASLKKISVSQKPNTPWNVTITAGEITGTSSTYVVILRYDIFERSYPGNDLAKLDAGNYNTLTANLSLNNNDRKYYTYEMHDQLPPGSNVELLNKSLTNFNSSANGYLVGESSTAYHMKYAAIIFDSNTDLKLREDYTIVTFYMDSEGHLQRESYMLRYMKNTYPVGNGTDATGLPGYTIHDWEADAPVNGSTTPKRTGYTFLGWDPNDKLMNADPNTAAAQTVTPAYPKNSTGPAPWATISQAFHTETFDKTSDKFYDLYAVWQPNKVEFNKTNLQLKTISNNGNSIELPVLTLPTPRVNVSYDSNPAVNLATSPTDKDTGKSYTCKLINSDNFVTNTDLSNGGSTATSGYGLTVSASGNMAWKITGTPQRDSGGKDVYALLTVTDNVNKTTDQIIIHFAEVLKGAQSKPTLDDNTGLQSRVQTNKVTDDATGTETEVKDGQIFGFYSEGPTLQTDTNPTGYFKKDSANHDALDGTGTMTGYYISQRMIYEYRPVEATEIIDGVATKKQYTDEDYNKLPNNGWREVPMTSNWYQAKYAEANRAKLDQSMELNAKVVMKTERNLSQGAYAPTTDVTPEGFEGWPSAYGYIVFEDSLNAGNSSIGRPVIHGLTENDVYQVRFRANDTNDSSDAQTIVIGGAVAASGGGETVSGGLAVNLAGGDIKSDDADAYAEFVEKCHAMAPGDSIEIPSFIPERENYSFAGWTLDVKDEESHELILYNYNAEAETPVSVTLGDKPTALVAVWNATTGGFASITFYDWDETTVLGSIVVPKGNATAAVAEFTKTLQAPTSQDVTKNAEDKFWIDDEEFPLTYKKGYSFEGCWLPFESETPTVYGYRVSAFNANDSTTPERPTEKEADFTNVTASMVVKASYNQNAELDISSNANRRYTSSIVDYMRYGTTQNYGITIEVRRENTNGAGVPRIVDPALRVTLVTTAGNLMMLLPLDSTDVATALVVANSAVSSIQWTLVDTYGNDNWVGAGVRMATNSRAAGTMNIAGSGFLYDSTLNGINGMLESYTTTNPKVTAIYNWINNNSLTGIGLRLPAGMSASDAKNKLLAAWEDKNCERDGEGTPVTDESGKKVIKAKDQREGLTFDEMQSALSS